LAFVATDKSYIVFITEDAMDDLKKIEALALAYSSTSVAKTRIRALYKRIEQLEVFPHAGKHDSTILDKSEEIRYVIKNHFRIQYQILDDHVYILQIVNAKGNPSSF